MPIRELEFSRSFVEQMDGIHYRLSIYEAPSYWLVLWECPICASAVPCLPAAGGKQQAAIEACQRNVAEHHNSYHTG